MSQKFFCTSGPCCASAPRMQKLAGDAHHRPALLLASAVTHSTFNSTTQFTTTIHLSSCTSLLSRSTFPANMSDDPSCSHYLYGLDPPEYDGAVFAMLYDPRAQAAVDIIIPVAVPASVGESSHPCLPLTHQHNHHSLLLRDPHPN